MDFEKFIANIPDAPDPPREPRIAIRATRTDCFTQQQRTVTCQLFAKNGYLHLEGGPTGYESMPIESLKKMEPGSHWAACFGTKQRWDALDVPTDEILRAAKELGVA